MLISLNKELGTDYFANPLERLQRMKNRTGMISTGWKAIDEKLYGGFNRGELNIFAAPPGGGKSIFLQNLAVNWSLMGLNVVYISLELSEDLIGLRLDAMLTQKPTKQIFKDMEDVALRLGMMAKQGISGIKPGKIQIKKMPEAGTSVNVVRAYLKEYEIQTGIRPDGLLVDYLDLLYPNNNKVDINNSINDIFDKIANKQATINSTITTNVGKLQDINTDIKQKTDAILASNTDISNQIDTLRKYFNSLI